MKPRRNRVAVRSKIPTRRGSLLLGFFVPTSEGREFQLRILDFYDEIGNKGHFVMESVER